MSVHTDHHENVSNVLASLDDAGMLALLDSAVPVGIGIGGSTMTVRINESTVFIKQLPLTKSEEANPTSTSLQVDLPFACHYGIGSPSHGVGRELAAHQVTTEWVHTGAVDFFPILLGWRVVELKCDAELSEFDGEAPPRQWGEHWSHIENRVAEMKDSTSSVVFFLEYVPGTLGDWLRESLSGGTGPEVFANVVGQLIDATAWMKAHGFQHFDLHPGNILVRDGRLLFTDFGLALYRGFDLTAEETAAMVAHENFDHDTALTYLFHWVLFELGYTSRPQRLALLRAVAADPATLELDPVRDALGDSVDLMAQYANIAVYATEMFDALMTNATATRYEPDQAGP